MKAGSPRTWRLVHLAVAGSAALAILGHYQHGEGRWLAFIFKPLATSLILAVAALRPATQSSRYRLAVIAGLALSLLGDVFLMVPKEGFLAGLASFLLAHICYLVAFTSGVRFAQRGMPLVVTGIALGAVLVAVWPRLPGNLRIPILVYATFLGAMASQAVVRGLVIRKREAVLAALGALFFLVSDSFLAFSRFHGGYALANILVLGTYYVAQWLIAMSVGQRQQRCAA